MVSGAHPRITYAPPDVLAAVRRLAPEVAKLDTPRLGLSGTTSSLGRDRAGRAVVFAKWADDASARPARELGVESAHLDRVQGLDRVAAKLGFDPVVPLLLTAYVEPDPGAVWDDHAWALATTTLTSLRSAASYDLGSVGDWTAFRAPLGDVLAAVTARSGDARLATALTECYRRFGGYTYGHDRAAPVVTPVLCHTDAHPGNWVLTAHGPVLVDFGRLALGPAGFDEVFLLAHLDAPLALRLRWLATATVTADVAIVVAGASAARLALGTTSSNPAWSAWCRHLWPHARDLAAALL
jgi:hypothetical protein